jgi:hypothetical protein
MNSTIQVTKFIRSNLDVGSLFIFPIIWIRKFFKSSILSDFGLEDLKKVILVRLLGNKIAFSFEFPTAIWPAPQKLFHMLSDSNCRNLARKL